MSKGDGECSQAVHNSAAEWIEYWLNRGADGNYVSELLNHASIQVLQPATRQIYLPI
jgi:site-specific recombinase XerD